MKNTEKTAPYATKLIRKGLPILDQKLKNLLDEIQERAKKTCKESKGTAAEEIAREINSEIQKWEIGSQVEMSEKVEDVAYILRTKVANLPENKYLLNKIEAMRYERNLTKQYETLLFVIGQIPTVKVISEQELDNKFYKFDLAYSEIVNIKDKLSCISFDISKIKLNSSNVISDLKTMQEELEKISVIESLNTLSIEKLDSIQAEELHCLNRNILERMEEIKSLINKLPKNSNIREFNDKLDELKQSGADTLLQRSSAIISLIGFAIQILQYKPV